MNTDYAGQVNIHKNPSHPNILFSVPAVYHQKPKVMIPSEEQLYIIVKSVLMYRISPSLYRVCMSECTITPPHATQYSTFFSSQQKLSKNKISWLCKSPKFWPEVLETQAFFRCLVGPNQEGYCCNRYSHMFHSYQWHLKKKQVVFPPYITVVWQSREFY